MKEVTHLFLLGFMGSGKTYWGRKWSRQSGISFLDLDELIEGQQQKTVEKIFAEEGELFFREQETKALATLPLLESFILSTGGGTPCFHDNITWMKNHGITIYLRSAPKKILARLQDELHTRPLISKLADNEIEDYITEKIKEREHFYNQAHLTIDVDDLPTDYLPVILRK